MIKPLFKNILIDIHTIDQSILAMVDDNEATIEKATVLDIGDMVELVKIGDTIVFKKYNLDTIEIDGKKYHLIPEDDVKGIII
jgi:chaperonin GroES